MCLILITYIMHQKIDQSYSTGPYKAHHPADFCIDHVDFQVKAAISLVGKKTC